MIKNEAVPYGLSLSMFPSLMETIKTRETSMWFKSKNLSKRYDSAKVLLDLQSDPNSFNLLGFQKELQLRLREAMNGKQFIIKNITNMTKHKMSFKSNEYFLTEKYVKRSDYVHFQNIRKSIVDKFDRIQNLNLDLMYDILMEYSIQTKKIKLGSNDFINKESVKKSKNKKSKNRITVVLGSSMKEGHEIHLKKKFPKKFNGKGLPLADLYEYTYHDDWVKLMQKALLDQVEVIGSFLCHYGSAVHDIKVCYLLLKNNTLQMNIKELHKRCKILKKSSGNHKRRKKQLERTNESMKNLKDKNGELQLHVNEKHKKIDELNREIKKMKEKFRYELSIRNQKLDVLKGQMMGIEMAKEKCFKKMNNEIISLRKQLTIQQQNNNNVSVSIPSINGSPYYFNENNSMWKYDERNMQMKFERNSLKIIRECECEREREDKDVFVNEIMKRIEKDFDKFAFKKKNGIEKSKKISILERVKRSPHFNC